ncbi:hypothetical protein ACFQY7_21820 [Actinomadura luteofluorescens]|uniref:hypothetical protein n=1 Tax=Actinomadura luteofluorescens TaxID=46163 RepID=UPI003632CD14
MAGSLTCMALVPLWPAALASAAVLGAGHGAYLAIDQALVTEVLPRDRDRAKDLGLITAAGSGAVAVAPLVAAGTLLAGGFSALFTAGCRPRRRRRPGHPAGQIRPLTSSAETAHRSRAGVPSSKRDRTRAARHRRSGCWAGFR